METKKPLEEENNLTPIEDPKEDTLIDTSQKEMPTEENTPLTARESFLARMKERKPDVDYDDEESRYGAYLDHDNEQQNRIGMLEEGNQRLTETFAQDPRFAEMMLDVQNGELPVVAFAKHFGDLMEMDMEDEEVASLVAEAQKERIRKIAEEEAMEKEEAQAREQRMDEVGKIVASFTEERGLSDEQMQEILDKFADLCEKGLKGTFTAEDLDFVSRGLRFDSEMEKARTDGLVAGRNEKINLEKVRRTGDGIPNLSAINSNVVGDKKPQVIQKKRSLYNY